MKKRLSLATVDDDFAAIDRLIRELRNRIAVAAETVRVAAARRRKRPKPKQGKRQGRRKK